MSEDAASPAPRTRDAERSRRALLEAGAVVFAEKGYSRARLRDIADRAGLDAALVIRYFGSKDGLYRATLDQDAAELPDPAALSGTTLAELVDDLVDRALARWDAHGVGTLALSLSRPDAGEETRVEVRERLESLLDPLTQAATRAGLPEPRLRAETALATLVGIGTVRSLQSLPELAACDRGTLEHLVRAAVTGALSA